MPGQAAPFGYGQEDPVFYGATAPGELVEKADDLQGFARVLPEAFNCGCLLVFAAPMVKSACLALDPLVAHWVGLSAGVATILPVAFVLAGYVVHRVQRRLSKWVVLLSLVGPSLALGIQANRTAMVSLELGQKFAVSDCATFPAKYDLEREWQAAALYRGTCGSNMAPSSYMVQDCPGYDAQAAFQHPSWEFLRMLESKYRCAGWCSPGKPLWMYGNPEDTSCSSAVAYVFTAKIGHFANQVLIYSLVVLSFSVAAVLAMGPGLHRHGVDW